MNQNDLMIFQFLKKRSNLKNLMKISNMININDNPNNSQSNKSKCIFKKIIQIDTHCAAKEKELLTV